MESDCTVLFACALMHRLSAASSGLDRCFFFFMGGKRLAKVPVFFAVSPASSWRRSSRVSLLPGSRQLSPELLIVLDDGCGRKAPVKTLVCPRQSPTLNIPLGNRMIDSQRLYDELCEDILSACSNPSAEHDSFQSVDVKTSCLKKGYPHDFCRIKPGQIILWMQADCDVSLDWQIGGVALNLPLHLPPRVPKLPLNNEHVLFVPHYHAVVMTPSRSCALTFTIASMKPCVDAAIWGIKQQMVLSPEYAILGLHGMYGILSLKRFESIRQALGDSPDDEDVVFLSKMGSGYESVARRMHT